MEFAVSRDGMKMFGVLDLAYRRSSAASGPRRSTARFAREKFLECFGEHRLEVAGESHVFAGRTTRSRPAWPADGFGRGALGCR